MALYAEIGLKDPSGTNLNEMFDLIVEIEEDIRQGRGFVEVVLAYITVGNLEGG